MRLTADYHTHTIYSHGKGDIIDNALAAKVAGLKELAISDHGFAHPVYGLTRRAVPRMKNLCVKASEQTGVNVLLGIESNIIGLDGKTDMKKDLYDYFDVYLAGVHKFVLYSFSAAFKMGIPNFLLSHKKRPNPSERLVKQNTEAYINAIKNNPIDVITHLNYCCYANVTEVAKAAADYGTYIELNAKKTHLSDEQLEAVVNTGVNFVISSDAHSPNRVGEISLVEKLLQRVKVPPERIANIDGRTPEFRFSRFKGRAGG